jgi:hypothetical protein
MWESALGGEDGADIGHYWAYSGDDGDARVTTQIQLDLLTLDPDAIVLMLSDLDTMGHAYGFSTEVDEYVSAMELIDEQLGQVLTAIRSRPTYEDEDWMIILSTDHAGTGYGHGDNIPEHRLVPIFIHGGGVVPGPIWPSPNTVSVAPTALDHLGIDIDPAWDLDGVPLGGEATAPPEATFDTNLIVNGDAEMERGFDGFFPDAALPGWTDEGWSTATAYGSDGFPSMESIGPDDRGSSFLCGGGTSDHTVIWQDIDLSGLSDAVDGGSVGYQLAGWLGGYSDQEDRAEVVLQLFDAAGVVLATETLPAVTSAERDDETGLRLRTRFGMISPFTRSARVTVNMYRSTGYNDGYADNLVFMMTEGK